MRETEPQLHPTATSLKAKIAFALGAAAIIPAFWFYLPLVVGVPKREEVYPYLFDVLLHVAAAHTALFLIIAQACRMRLRGAVAFWSASAAVLLSVGGWKSVEAFCLTLAFGFVATGIGGVLSRRLLPADSRNWGVSLGLGILSLSVCGAFLAWLHLFNWWMLSILILITLVPGLRVRVPILRDGSRRVWKALETNLNLSLAIGLQGLFLLGSFAYVVAMAPETSSDAARFYLPYVKLLRHYSGFFDEPRQWFAVIPQAGVTYGSAVLMLAGEGAARLSMLLGWCALIGMLCRRSTSQSSSLRCAIALVVASCPMVLWVSPSLMMDTFVCVSVVILAIICVEGETPGSVKFWVAVGVCAATAWAAKYTTLAYALPLLAIASARSFKTAGLIKTARGLSIAALSSLAALSPWLVHSYRQSGNPIFPFFLGLFPSPLWPRGVGFGNLANFRLAGGWRGWLLAPVDLTYHTSRFVEGLDGGLGLALVVLLIVALAALWKGSYAARLLAATGIIGTILLINQTAYVRYWLPGLWLIALAGCITTEKSVGPGMARIVSACAFIIAASQVCFAMVNNWADPRGWPWEVYTRAINESVYLGRNFKGFQQLEKVDALARGWPKVWFTSFEGTGHLQVKPLEATLWEIGLHVREPRAKIQYLASAGCEYWIVNEDGVDAYWFKVFGLSRFFWTERNLAARAGAVSVYRMRSAAETMADFDALARPGAELLLDGGFENGKDNKLSSWMAEDGSKWLSPDSRANEGQGCVQLRQPGAIRQQLVLPAGVHSLCFVASARSGEGGQDVSLEYRFVMAGFERDPGSTPVQDQVEPEHKVSDRVESVIAGPQWRQQQFLLSVPPLARYITVIIAKPDGDGAVLVDSVHLYTR